MARTMPIVLCCLCLAGWAATQAQETAPARYQPPQAGAQFVFPVARSNWYSVINFSNDWHAPRMRKIDGGWKQVGIHEGNDLFAEPGTPVRAVTDGVVARIGWLFYSGWRLGITDDEGRYWFYAHLSEYAPGLAEGTRVEAGDRIGAVGNTGYGVRPGHRDEFVAHLHVGIREPGGEWVNPYPLMKRLYGYARR
ncbi:MAG: M23 family metallopeptidase [Actinomycetota bacterium]|nr:M23 family metallopeptidase [Actinomycetota bacterium]